MVNNVQNLTNVRNLLFKSDSPQLNSSLPVALEILEKTSPTKYLAKIGNLTMDIKSMRDLQVGAKYWAEIGRSSVGTTLVSNLANQPKLLSELSNSPLKLNENALKSLIESNNPFADFKSAILDKLADAKSSGEFNLLSQLLVSIHKDVLTLPIDLEDEDAFLQAKKPKKSEKQQNFIEFFAAFPHLGGIAGKIFLDGEELELYLTTQYKSTKRALEESLKDLKGFSHIRIEVDRNIVPFYEFSNSLLDVKG